MEKIDEKYIYNAINELKESIGVKEYANKEHLYSLVHQNKMNECILEIAMYLGLPIRINLSFISNGSFNTQKIVTTDKHGRGNGGITAQVHIPQSLPLYGSDSMKNMLIDIKISENCKKSASAFVAIMAHELSHIVLNCLIHKEKDNEYYTDITAMMLGFNDIMNDGRIVTETTTEHYFNSIKTTTKTTKYGYLDDDQFYLANKKIKEFIDDNRNKKKIYLKQIKSFTSSLKKNQNIVKYFDKTLSCIDKQDLKLISMSTEEGSWIVNLHHPEYIDDIVLTIKTAQEDLKKIKKFILELNLYSSQNLNILDDLLKKNCENYTKTNQKKIKIAEDTKLLKKHLSLYNKIKLYFI